MEGTQVGGSRIVVVTARERKREKETCVDNEAYLPLLYINPKAAAHVAGMDKNEKLYFVVLKMFWNPGFKGRRAPLVASMPGGELAQVMRVARPVMKRVMIQATNPLGTIDLG